MKLTLLPGKTLTIYNPHISDEKQFYTRYVLLNEGSAVFETIKTG